MISTDTKMSAELSDMLAEIQPYALWHIIPLENLVNRYFQILKLVNGMSRFGRGCTLLNMSTGSLAGFMRVSINSRDAFAYSRASFELRGDIHDLIGVLRACA